MEDEFNILRPILLLTMGALVVGVVMRAGRDAAEQRARLEASRAAMARPAVRAEAVAAAASSACRTASPPVKPNPNPVGSK